MPTSKVILSAAATAELRAAVSRLDVSVDDRRRKESLVAGLVARGGPDFSDVLNAMSAAGLKELAHAISVTPEGRGKAAVVAALVAAAAPRPRARPAAKAPPKSVAQTAAKPAAKRQASTPSSAPAPKAAPAPSVTKPRPKPKARAKGPAQAVQGVAAATGQTSKTAPVPAAEAGHIAQVSAPIAHKEAAPGNVLPPPVPAAHGAPIAPAPAPEADSAPVAPKKPVRRGPLSWSEAAQMAADRGQSAASMLQPALPQTSGLSSHTCTKCHQAVALQTCQVQACNNRYVASPGRKICSECLFERNTISMDDFNERLHEERLCTHCHVPMTHLAAPGNS